MTTETTTETIKPETLAIIDAIIERAVALAQEHAKHFPLAPGTVVLHPSDPVTGLFDHYDGDEALMRWDDGRVGRFPRHEVCDANVVCAYCGRLQYNLRVDPTIPIGEHPDGVF